MKTIITPLICLLVGLTVGFYFGYRYYKRHVANVAIRQMVEAGKRSADRKRDTGTPLGSVNFEVVFPTMQPVCPWYRTLDDLKKDLIEPYEGDAHLQLFEKDGTKVAVCVLPQGGIGWDAVIIYQFKSYLNFWGSTAFWDPYAMNVKVTFDQSTGMIEARSGGDRLLFSANIAALKARQNPFDW